MTNPIIVETIHVVPPDGGRSTGGVSIPVVPVEPLRPPQSPVEAALAQTRKELAEEVRQNPTSPSLADYGLITHTTSDGNPEQK